MTIRLFYVVVIGLLIITGCKKDNGTNDSDNNSTSKQAYIPDLSGSYSPSSGSWAKAIRIQKDGKILALGDKWFVRLEKEGLNIDNTFNPVTEIASSSNVNAFELQDDGKIIVFGKFVLSSGRKAIVRLNADGSLDNSFNNPNLDINYQAQSINIYAVALQANGKMVIAGAFSYRTSPTSYAYGIARLNADQSLDYSFVSPISGGDVYNVQRMLPLSDGGFLLTGYGAITLKGGASYAVVKINADGIFDNTYAFGSGGSLDANSVIGTDMKALADGKTLVGWYSGNIQAQASYVARTNANGSVDAGFNAFGVSGYIRAVLELPDKSVLVGNTPNLNITSEQYLIHLSSGGIEDTAFHPGFTSGSGIFCLANVDETTVLAGGSLNIGDKKYAVVRLRKNK